MTTISTSALTPKQKQVYDLISKGMAPADVAKRLKISPSGVYGHIRNIKAAGLPLAVPTEPAPAVSPPASALNGTVDPAASLKTAIAQGEQRAAAIDAEVESLNARIEALHQEQAALEVSVTKYETALKALA